MAETNRKTITLAELQERLSRHDPLHERSVESNRNALRLMLDLRQRRRNRHLRQADVAELMGTRQSVVSDIERGFSDPRLSTLVRYAAALGLALRFQPVDGVTAPTAVFRLKAPQLAGDWTNLNLALTGTSPGRVHTIWIGPTVPSLHPTSPAAEQRKLEHRNLGELVS